MGLRRHFVKGFLKHYVKDLQDRHIHVDVRKGLIRIDDATLELDPILQTLEGLLPAGLEIESVRATGIRVAIPWQKLRQQSVQISVSAINVAVLHHPCHCGRRPSKSKAGSKDERCRCGYWDAAVKRRSQNQLEAYKAAISRSEEESLSQAIAAGLQLRIDSMCVKVRSCDSNLDLANPRERDDEASTPFVVMLSDMFWGVVNARLSPLAGFSERSRTCSMAKELRIGSLSLFSEYLGSLEPMLRPLPVTLRLRSTSPSDGVTQCPCSVLSRVDIELDEISVETEERPLHHLCLLLAETLAAESLLGRELGPYTWSNAAFEARLQSQAGPGDAKRSPAAVASSAGSSPSSSPLQSFLTTGQSALFGFSEVAGGDQDKCTSTSAAPAASASATASTASKSKAQPAGSQGSSSRFKGWWPGSSHSSKGTTTTGSKTPTGHSTSPAIGGLQPVNKGNVSFSMSTSTTPIAAGSRTVSSFSNVRSHSGEEGEEDEEDDGEGSDSDAGSCAPGAGASGDVSSLLGPVGDADAPSQGLAVSSSRLRAAEEEQEEGELEKDSHDSGEGTPMLGRVRQFTATIEITSLRVNITLAATNNTLHFRMGGLGYRRLQSNWLIEAQQSNVEAVRGPFALVTATDPALRGAQSRDGVVFAEQHVSVRTLSLASQALAAQGGSDTVMLEATNRREDVLAAVWRSTSGDPCLSSNHAVWPLEATVKNLRVRYEAEWWQMLREWAMEVYDCSLQGTACPTTPRAEQAPSAQEACSPFFAEEASSPRAAPAVPAAPAAGASSPLSPTGAAASSSRRKPSTAHAFTARWVEMQNIEVLQPCEPGQEENLPAKMAIHSANYENVTLDLANLTPIFGLARRQGSAARAGPAADLPDLDNMSPEQLKAELMMWRLRLGQTT